MTLRIRFALWVAALLLVVLAAFGAFVYLNLAQGLAGSLDDSLRLAASQAIAAVNIENGQINFSDSILEGGNVAAELQERGLTIRIADPSGRVVQAFGPYRELLLPLASSAGRLGQQPAFATLADPRGGAAIRVYTAPILDNGQAIGTVEIAEDLSGVQEPLGRLLTALLLGGPVLVLAAALGGYFLAARALAPIDQITHTAQRIAGDAEGLSARLNLPVSNDEVGRLATTFDDMLARLDEAFRRERQFTADASHELRTPLAAMQAILSVTREKRRASEDYELAMADLADETDRLRGLVEDLLRLARGETQPLGVGAQVDLSTLLRDVTDSLRPLAEAKGLALTCNVPHGLVLAADSDGLIRLFVNLLDNAVKYSERGEIVVAACRAADGLYVTVADSGIGIPSEHLPHVFDRFYRVDKARSERGAGLGLAIALDIARAHGGTIAVDSTLGAGTTFTVHLPA